MFRWSTSILTIFAALLAPCTCLALVLPPGSGVLPGVGGAMYTFAENIDQFTLTLSGTFPTAGSITGTNTFAGTFWNDQTTVTEVAGGVFDTITVNGTAFHIQDRAGDGPAPAFNYNNKVGFSSNTDSSNGKIDHGQGQDAYITNLSATSRGFIFQDILGWSFSISGQHICKPPAKSGLASADDAVCV
jgi:hypothetical protein